MSMYRIQSKVQSDSSHVARLSSTADVTKLQLQVMPAAITHLHLVKPQAHRLSRTSGHREHQLPRCELHITNGTTFSTTWRSEDQWISKSTSMNNTQHGETAVKAPQTGEVCSTARLRSGETSICRKNCA